MRRNAPLSATVCFWLLCWWSVVGVCESFSCPTGGTQLEARVCLPAGYTSSQLPPNTPVQVGVGFNINYFTTIDDIGLTFSVNQYLNMQWNEPRLILDTANIGNTSVRMSADVFTQYLWKPDLFVYFLSDNKQAKLLDTLNGISVNANGTLLYFTTITTTVGCKMNFDNFPMDQQTCNFLLSSSNFLASQVSFNSTFNYDATNQRSQNFVITVSDLPAENKSYTADDGTYSQVGFVVTLVRYSTPYLLQYYLPCGAMVIVSTISFLINLDVIPARVALLVTIFLVLTTIFGSIQSNTPKSHGLTALGVYALTCLIFVFVAMMEFAFLLLVKRRFLKKKDLEERSKSENNSLESTVTTVKSWKSSRATSAEVGPASYTAPDKTSAKTDRSVLDVNDLETFCYKVDEIALPAYVVAFIIFNIAYAIYYVALR